MNTVEPIRDIGKVHDIADYLREKSERNYILFTFGIYTGLRVSDILKLQVRDVRDKDRIYVREQKTGKENAFMINDELRPDLNRYIKGKSDYEYLFHSKRSNKPITRQQAYNILSEAGAVFGLQRIGTHTMRKTFGYHFYQQTKDAATLKEILNHSSIQITMRYIGITEDIKNEKMSRLSYKKR